MFVFEYMKQDFQNVKNFLKIKRLLTISKDISKRYKWKHIYFFLHHSIPRRLKLLKS